MLEEGRVLWDCCMKNVEMIDFINSMSPLLETVIVFLVGNICIQNEAGCVLCPHGEVTRLDVGLRK